MENTLLVRLPECRRDFHEPSQQDCQRRHLLVQHLEQRVPHEHLHRHVNRVVLGHRSAAVQLHDVRVVERHDDFRLAVKTLLERLVLHVLALEYLERDRLARVLVPGPVNLAHPAFADERDRDVLPADERAQKLVVAVFAPIRLLDEVAVACAAFLI